MQLLSEIFIGFFSAYLAFTNGIADQVDALFSMDDPEEAVIQKISSAYDSIPRILIENAAYQQGNIIEGASQTAATATPLEALVNIYCMHTVDTYTRTTTGTGFFIHDDGVILTNAHVAQFLLLETVEGDTDCIIRAGNPAVPTYEVDLLYISPAWVQEHANLIDAANPRGTGERDYALLYVTAGLNNTPMPRGFPALKMNTTLMPAKAIGWGVRAAGYPAEEMMRSGDMAAALAPKEVDTSIAELLTFSSNYADLMTIEGGIIGEQGSSGGPVVNSEGQAIGIISTKGDHTVYSDRSLRALTLSYVDRTMEEETGYRLEAYLGGNLPYRSKLFKETLGPFLKRMLERELRD